MTGYRFMCIFFSECNIHFFTHSSDRSLFKTQMLIQIFTLHFCKCININSYKSHLLRCRDRRVHGYLYHFAIHVVYTNTTHHSNSKAPHISVVHIVRKTCLAAFSKHKNTDYGFLRDFNGLAGVQTGILAKEHIYTKPYFPECQPCST